MSVVRNGAPADVRDAVERGYTLPAAWYTDPDHFRNERERILRRHWHYVGHVDQAAQPGEYFRAVLDQVPLVIVRDESSALNAFVNVCRHRGSEVVLDRAGKRKTLQCHYHGWTWNLDGTLRAAPRSNEQPNFNPADFPLWQVRLETFGPFIFANLDPEAPPLARTLGELPALLAETALSFADLRLRGRREYEIHANWKVIVENYLECYHCPIAHPGFSSMIDLDNYRLIPYEYFSVQRGPARDSDEENGQDRQSGGSAGNEGIYIYLWPNFMLNTYPGPGMLSLNLMQPLAVDRTRAIFEFYFSDAYGEAEIAEMIAFIDQVQQEDTILCESVQRGLSSGYYQQGRLILSRESGLQHFQGLVVDALREPAAPGGD